LELAFLVEGQRVNREGGMALGMVALLACREDWDRVGENNKIRAHLIGDGFLGLFHNGY